jgi:hypothetical protein
MSIRLPKQKHMNRFFGTGLLGLGLSFLIPWTCLSQIVYKSRKEYQQKHEPSGGIWVGAGQAGKNSFAEFTAACDSVKLPYLYMDYVGLDKLDTAKLRTRIRNWQSFPWKVMPQIGLSMTYDGKAELHYEDKVAAGLYDAEIDMLTTELGRFSGPVMIRLGYEFNGHWNGYQPESFRKAYRHVAGKLRKALGSNLSLVWCAALDGDRHDFEDFYPGDDVVDWWGIDVFGANHFQHPALAPFLKQADQHHRPVLIGECSPRRVSVQLGKESVEKWFKPFFQMLAENPGIKGISYIYWDWSKTPWADWGDGRFGTNPETRAFVTQELRNPIFFGSGKK